MSDRKRRHDALPESIVVKPRGRRFIWTALVVVALSVSLVCTRSGQPSRPAQTSGTDVQRYHDRTFRVARVVDGDTLDIDVPDGAKSTTRIRLWGVDTPEVAGSRGGPMYFGREASDFAKKTLEGRDVHVVLSPSRRTRGKYGRLLAYVFLTRGGVMFNELLIEKGYAYADLRFDHSYFDRFKALEKLARSEGVGLWADIATEKMPPWRRRFERKHRSD